MIKLAVSVFALCAGANAAPCAPSDPTANVRNGTYVGTRNEAYDQDYFLGMPYAQQPVGDLRFSVPQSLNESWNGERGAKEYSDACVGYGVSTTAAMVVLTDGHSRIRFGTPIRNHALQ